ncbi:MAG: type II 3-dehydroquinate dehydratase [Victivallaceae bacterium]
MKILVVNGPNLQALGRREVGIYGKLSWSDIAAQLEAAGAELGMGLVFFQSNSEGSLIDRIWQAAEDKFDGIIINPGGLTHTSVALLDALRGAALPAVEVHLSNISGREEYRHKSVTAAGCIGVVAGFRAESYVLALRGLHYHLLEK